MTLRTGKEILPRHPRRAGVLGSTLLFVSIVGCGWTADLAEARAHCPSGQIYRVTKGICVSRSDASSVGIRVHGHSARAHLIGHSRRGRVVEAARDDDDDAASMPTPTPRPAITPARVQSADNGPPLQETRQVATGPVPTARASASPYGALPKTVGEGLATLTARP